jgi:hypothetical protein
MDTTDETHRFGQHLKVVEDAFPAKRVLDDSWLLPLRLRLPLANHRWCCYSLLHDGLVNSQHSFNCHLQSSEQNAHASDVST